MAIDFNQEHYLAPTPQLQMTHMPCLSFNSIHIPESFMDLNTFPSLLYSPQSLDSWSNSTEPMSMTSSFGDMVTNTNLSTYDLSYPASLYDHSADESLKRHALAQMPSQMKVGESAATTIFSSSFSGSFTNFKAEGSKKMLMPVSLPGSLPVERESAEASTSGGHPGEPYAKLIHRALMSSPTRSMVLQEIYQWFRTHTPERTRKSETGWKNSIRHNLSMNAAFKKVERVSRRDTSKKSTEWALEPFAIKDGVQSTTRYRKGVGLKKYRQPENLRKTRQRWNMSKTHIPLQGSMGYTGSESRTIADSRQPAQDPLGMEMSFWRQISPMTSPEPNLYFMDTGLGDVNLEMPFRDSFDNSSFGITNAFPSVQNWWANDGLPRGAY
ncbi:hypothetical protein K3495_g11124 [Podosphaera aphanis]|nr:hypothetical protein K3495_g11124 [Podosphaera aphanis]